MIEKRKGIVLKSIDFKESSKIIYLLTEQGRKSLIVRGAKKLNSRHLFLTNSYVEILFQAKEADLPNLIEGDLLFDFSYIRKDLNKYLFAENISSLLRLVADESDFSRIYRLYHLSLFLINKDIDAELVSFSFEIKLLYFLGVKPNFTSCIICESENNIKGIDVINGGVVCAKHFEPEAFNLETAILIRNLFYVKPEEVALLTINTLLRKDIRFFLEKFYEVHLGYQNTIFKKMLVKE